MPNVLRAWFPVRRPARFLLLSALSGALLATVEANAPRALMRPAQAQDTTPQLAPNCPLPVNLAATFLDSKCTRTVLTRPQIFFRHFSTEGNRYGRYLTTDRFKVNTEVIRALALNQEWGNQATRTLLVTLPAGTVVFQGVVAPQTPSACYPGGGQQTFIENSKDPRITWVEGPPLTVESFSCP
jgi:hypothetical protein